MSQMTEREKQIEQAAMGSSEPPKDMEIYEQVYFLGLKYLYALYRRNEITREKASEMKLVLQRQCSDFRADWKLSTWWAECYRKTESASSAYRKERTLENADLLLKSIDKIEVPDYGR